MTIDRICEDCGDYFLATSIDKDFVCDACYANHLDELFYECHPEFGREFEESLN